MTWNSTWPVGTVSVKANRTTGAQNTSYIETKLKLDHYWNEDSNSNGHHKKVEMPDISNITSDPFSLDSNGDPTLLSTGMDCMLYTRPKTATEAVDTQQDEPFTYTIEDPSGTAVNHYMQLGFRCMVCFNGSSSTPAQSAVVYSHNIALQSAGSPGVTRDAKGLYTINFAVDLPSTNYIVFGNGIRNDSSSSNARDLGMYMQNATSLSSVKTKSLVKVMFKSNTGDLYDPLQGFIAICGG